MATKKKNSKQKSPEEEKLSKKRLCIFQLVLGIVLIIAGFVSLFGAFTLVGGGCLILSLTNYIAWKGTPKANSNTVAPDDSLNNRR